MARLPGRGVLAFGIACAVATPFFWLLGLMGVYQLATSLSPKVGLAITIAVALVLLYRASLSVVTYLRSLSEPVRQLRS